MLPTHCRLHLLGMLSDVPRSRIGMGQRVCDASAHGGIGGRRHALRQIATHNNTSQGDGQPRFRLPPLS